MGLGIKGGRRRAPMPSARLARRPGSEERGRLTRRAADRRSKLPRALGTCKDKTPRQSCLVEHLFSLSLCANEGRQETTGEESN